MFKFTKICKSVVVCFYKGFNGTGELLYTLEFQRYVSFQFARIEDEDDDAWNSIKVFDNDKKDCKIYNCIDNNYILYIESK